MLKDRPKPHFQRAPLSVHCGFCDNLSHIPMLAARTFFHRTCPARTCFLLSVTNDLFYVPSDECGFLCNFSAHGFTLDDRYWPTVEHFFQSQKFAGTEHEERIRVSRNPKEAKTLGQTRKLPLRPDWEDVKVEIMCHALNAKFTTHAELREALLATGNEELVENAPTDYFWGCGQLGGGQNMLGKLLMGTRQALRNGDAESAAIGG